VQPKLLPDQVLAIDLGLDNLATCVNNIDGSSFILDGKHLKSLNHPYNMCMAQLQSLLDQQQLPRSERMARITINRNPCVHDARMKTARYIVNDGIAHAVGTLIVGCHPGGTLTGILGERYGLRVRRTRGIIHIDSQCA
jgi:transposase